MLPQKFIDNMTYLYGPDETERFIACLDKPMYHCLRVNTLKISPEEFLELTPFHLEPVPWCPNAFYYDDDVNPAKHPYYYAGLYYLQEPSATLPAATLPIEPGDRVLDLCAAPGGKSTELGARQRGEGILVSNDISASRAKALLKNIELFGIGNSLITTENGNKLLGTFEGYFDKILIDAPCSGEGMFRKSRSMITAWENNGVDYFADLQKTIIRDAVRMLRPGGSILYSTCTYNHYEDEMAVEFILSQDESLSLCRIEERDGFVPGIPSAVEPVDPELVKTMHLFPHRVKGEGHFVSLMKSGGNAEECMSVSSSADDGKNLLSYKNCITSDYMIRNRLKDEATLDFLGHISRRFDLSRFEVDRDKVYYIPDGMPDTSGLRVMRRGLLFGEIKKNRFEPSQALAMNLKCSEYDNVTDLAADDIRVIKYLKGETIEADSSDGFTLVSVDGYPLGFAKAKDGTLKNKYLPGWRMM